MNCIWKLKVLEKSQHFICFATIIPSPTNARRHYCSMTTSSSCTCCSSPMEDLSHCLRECLYSKELWLRLGMSLHSTSFLQTNVKVWIHDMACSVAYNIFIAGLWQSWCWRNNMIFEDQH